MIGPLTLENNHHIPPICSALSHVPGKRGKSDLATHRQPVFLPSVTTARYQPALLPVSSAHQVLSILFQECHSNRAGCRAVPIYIVRESECLCCKN